MTGRRDIATRYAGALGFSLAFHATALAVLATIGGTPSVVERPIVVAVLGDGVGTDGESPAGSGTERGGGGQRPDDGADGADGAASSVEAIAAPATSHVSPPASAASAAATRRRPPRRERAMHAPVAEREQRRDEAARTAATDPSTATTAASEVASATRAPVVASNAAAEGVASASRGGDGGTGAAAASSGAAAGVGSARGHGGGNGGDLRPWCAICPTPEYPARARRQGWQGTVDVDLHVGRDGVVEHATVGHSSGFAILDAAAVTEARRSRFRVAAGSELHGQLRYRFVLEEARDRPL